MGDEMADEGAKEGNNMHPGKVTGSMSPAHILQKKQILPSPARKWTLRGRSQKLTQD